MSWYQFFALLGGFSLGIFVVDFVLKRRAIKKQQEEHLFYERKAQENFIRESEMWKDKIIIIDQNSRLKEFLDAFIDIKKEDIKKEKKAKK